MPITILECAVAHGAKPGSDGSFTVQAINTAGFHFIGGCSTCRATIAAYNAYPTKGGFWRCADCVGDNGFDTVEQFDAATIESDRKFHEFCYGDRPRLTKENA